jgi:DNA polymerase-3 subunit beta
MFTKVIKGDFPDYERVIPKSTRYQITVPKLTMINSIKKVNIISPNIKINFNKNNIEIESLNDENFEAKTEFENSNSIDEEIVIALNSRHLIDFLSHIDTNEFVIAINESKSPFILSSENFMAVIMPIQI